LHFYIHILKLSPSLREIRGSLRQIVHSTCPEEMHSPLGVHESRYR